MLAMYQVRGSARLGAPQAEAKALYREIGKVPGVEVKEGLLLMPADPRLAELAESFGLELSPEAKAWYAQAIQGELQCAALLDRHDVALEHPQASRLYPYQRVGASFVASTGNCILADLPGMGKTAQVVVGVECSRLHDKVLVVCPSTLKLWWATERSHWTKHPDQPVSIISSKERFDRRAYSTGWVIVNYEMLRVQAAEFSSIYWDWLVLDEAQRAKNRKTQTFRALKSLKARRKVLLTGTPFGNDPSELWALLHLIDPQRYSSFWRFYELYVEYEEDFYGTRLVMGVKHPHLLRRELAPRMARRTQDEVGLQLPPKINQTLPLPLNGRQRKAYWQMVERSILELDDGATLTAFDALAKLTRLRQIVSTPANFDLPDDSSKLDACLDLIQDTDERVLVFTLFRATAHCLCARLKGLGLPHALIIGDQSLVEREAAARALNQGETRVLVATLGAGGVGLNLQGASTVIFIDKHYNPEKQQQAEERAHRIGSTQRVRVISLHCPGTVDDLVERILEKKVAMQDDVLGVALLHELRGELDLFTGAP